MRALGLTIAAALALAPASHAAPDEWTHLASAQIASGRELWDSPLGRPIRAALEAEEDVRKLRAGFQLATRVPLERALDALLGGPLDIEVHVAQQSRSRLQDGERSDPHVILRARTERGEDTRKLLDSTLAMVQQHERVRRATFRGVDYARIGDDVLCCVVGDTLLLSSHDDLLAAAIDALLDGDAGPPQRHAPGVHFRAQRPDGALATDGSSAREPLANLLFAGLIDIASGAQSLDAHLTWTDEELVLDALIDTDAEPAVSPYAPLATTATSIPTTSHTLGIFFARRDLAEWWRRRETLMSMDVQKQLAKFDADMTTLFSGQDLAEDVFARLGDAWALVVGRQDFALADRAPDVRLPGFCLVARIREGEEAALKATMRVAFQSVLGFVNADRGEKGLAPFLVDADVHDGVPVYAARLLPDLGRTGVAPGSLEFNFTPSLALVDDWLLLGSSAEQVKRLVSSIGSDDVEALSSNTTLDVDVSRSLALAHENRSALVAQTVLEKGLDVVAAAQEIDMLFDLAGLLDRLRVDVTPGSEGLALRLTLDAAANR